MGSPRRGRKEQEKRGDIKERLQALAKSSASDIKKSSSNPASKTGSKAQPSRAASKDHRRNDSTTGGSRKGIEQMMEKARTEGGNRWTKKLLDEEAKDPDRWGHSGFKELYKSELGIKSRRTRSRERPKGRRSRSRDRPDPAKTNRERARETRTSPDVRRRRSLSSSDRSVTGSRRRSDPSKRANNGKSNDRHAPDTKASRSSETRSGRAENPRRGDARKRDLSLKKDRLKKQSISRSRSRSRSPVRPSEKAIGKKAAEPPKRNATKRGPVSPPLNKYSRSRSSSRSSGSPVRRRASISDSSQSSSSRSQSSMSRSSSSSSSSDRSSSSDSSPNRRRPAKRRPPNNSPRTKAKQDHHREELQKSKHNHAKLPKRPSTDNKVKASIAKKWRDRSDSRSTSNASSDSESDEIEEGEDDDIDRDDEHLKDTKSGNPPQRISLSERFGKLAQLSSQRRNLELVQLRIVAPVGGTGTIEKNVSVDETSAAPVISHKPPRERSAEPPAPQNNHHQHVEHHNYKHVHHHEEHPLPDERARDDRWRDWHERYDHYRHVQPPRQLPRDWDDIRVRHKYYTDRGYFGHDMTLEELSRWEAWWHRYQNWRRGYEHAWIKTHGPHVPVEYPDWSHYRSSSREVAPVSGGASSIRSRLGWRR